MGSLLASSSISAVRTAFHLQAKRLLTPGQVARALKFSQPEFALLLHTSASTVRKWEQGETHPTGPALKLLNVIAGKGLLAII